MHPPHWCGWLGSMIIAQLCHHKRHTSQHNRSFECVTDCRNVHQSCFLCMKCPFLYHKPPPKLFLWIPPASQPWATFNFGKVFTDALNVQCRQHGWVVWWGSGGCGMDTHLSRCIVFECRDTVTQSRGHSSPHIAAWLCTAPFLYIYTQILDLENTPVLACPADTLDMSLIEHVWDTLDQHIQAWVPVSDTIQQLCTALLEDWTDSPEATVNNPISSMWYWFSHPDPRGVFHCRLLEAHLFAH